MTALFSSAKRKQDGIRWLLVAQTTTMFIPLTISTGIYLYLGVIAYVDNREFTLYEGFSEGPTGYLGVSNAKVIASVPSVLMVLNGWLADGLLVFPIPNPMGPLSYPGHFSSCAVATLSIP